MDFFERTQNIIDWPKAQKDIRDLWSAFSGKTTDLSGRHVQVLSKTGEQIRRSLAGLQSNTKNFWNRGFWQNPKFWKMGTLAGATIVGMSAINALIKRMTPLEPVIPKYYDKGYDDIKRRMTDFGSPVRLNKAAAKIITPYKSAVRRGKVTTANTIIKKNMALYNSSRAIEHTRY